jgi:chemotaxis protein methyltransferase CheR
MNWFNRIKPINKQTVETIDLQEEEIKSLLDVMNEKHGIDFRCYEPKSLNQRIRNAVSAFKFKSALELWSKILKDRAFIREFMDEISIGLPTMFRDHELWKSFKRILHEADCGQEPLKIWYAGCSTGEEIYTMAIVLKESGIKRPYSIWATDVNHGSLATAKKGEYSKSMANEFEKKYSEYNTSGKLSKYYKSSGNTIQFDPKLISNVSFAHHHLFSDPLVNTFDVIMCRSVMYHFDNNAKQMLFEKFHRSLNAGGCLAIGFYDVMWKLVNRNKFEVFDLNAKIFAKSSQLF